MLKVPFSQPSFNGTGKKSSVGIFTVVPLSMREPRTVKLCSVYQMTKTAQSSETALSEELDYMNVHRTSPTAVTVDPAARLSLCNRGEGIRSVVIAADGDAVC